MLNQKFKACLWKTYRARMRNLILTVLEIIFPIILFVLLAYIHVIDVKNSLKHPFPQYRGMARNLSSLVELGFGRRNHVDIVFTPNTDVVVNIMDSVFEEVFIKNKIEHKIRTFDGVPKEMQVATWLADKYVKEDSSDAARSVGFGFVFRADGRLGEIFDVPLDYTIMCSLSSIDTTSTFPHDMNSTRGSSGMRYINSGVPVLQWYVEKTLIRLMAHVQSVPFDIEIHSFPYPEINDTGVNDKLFITILLPIFTMISFIFFIPVVIRIVVQEKATGVKELQRIMGMTSWYLWASWFCHSVCLFMITTPIVTLLLGLSFADSNPFLGNVDLSVLWILFFLFCIASLIFCFAISTMFNNPVAAMSCGVVLWIGTFTVLNPLVTKEHVPLGIRVLVCLFPPAAITTGFNIISHFDSINEDLTWSRVLEKTPLSSSEMNMATVYLMLLVDMLFYMILTWYFDSVKPGPFGIAKPWDFIFVRAKLKKTLSKIPKGNENALYEMPSPYLKVGIYVDNLRKVYNDDVVGLDGVTMNLYQGVITVLLGHNGAGKTSLMGIISGLHSPTSGNVIVGGHDIFSNMTSFRKNVGICFQYNYLFSYLSVFEHFIFFGMVRGMSFKRAKKEGMALLRDLNMMDKRNDFVSKLSGGILRRVSLAVALIGNPKVLLLDEPTCGMDPETRREVWDIILKRRGNHTIVITTQFMEEADVLGDWIAIMDHGKVVCYGTTQYLKSMYGTGYRLTVTKGKMWRPEPITSVIKRHVPQCKVENVTPTLVNYNLPLEITDKFPEMFVELEQKERELGISSLGIQCTTIEEVFLKVGELLQGKADSEITKFLLTNLPLIMDTSSNLKGASLVFQQFKALLVKKLLFDMRNLFFLVIMIIIPLVIVALSFPSKLHVKTSNDQRGINASLKLYGHTTAFASSQVNKVEGDKLLNSYKTVVENQGSTVNFTNNVTNALTTFGKQHLQEFRMHTIASVAFNGKRIQAFFSHIPWHAIPISINLVSNSLLKYYFPNNTFNITFTYRPIDINAAENSCLPAMLKLGDSIGHQWAVSIPQCLLCIMTLFIMLPALEHSTTCKHLQLMTGVTPLLYWLSCFIWDFFLFGVVSLVFAITVIICDKLHHIASPNNIVMLIFILLLYGLSGTTYAYFASNFGTTTSKIIGNFLVFSICFGMVLAIVMNVATQKNYSGENFIPNGIFQVLTYTLPLCPHYCFVSTILLFASGTYQNSLCKNCPDDICTEEQLLVFNSKEHPHGFLLYIIYMSLDWLLYLGLLLMADHRVFSNICWTVKDMAIDVDFDDNDIPQTSDVSKEKEKTLACVQNRYVDPKAIFLCLGLGKIYPRNNIAVHPMYFRVRRGECFGLLGTNSAGKSTAFKLLVGEVKATVGNAVIKNSTLIGNRRQYLKTIGYCPQMGALNYAFTGEETLRLFAQLRGIHPRRLETEVDNWIRLLALNDYRSLPCGTYSGGTRRKLSTAIALIGHPTMVFLDEPTSGVDPFGRRNLWEVLNASKTLGQAILLTSHSMRECESLCGRLTIMVSGKMVCMGNTQYLKKKFGQGYTVALTLHTNQELQETIPDLKQEMNRRFGKAKLKDEHKKLLHYHVKDREIVLSHLFRTMEDLKEEFPVINSYTLGDTTLEQVFISFAKSHIKPEIIV